MLKIPALIEPHFRAAGWTGPRAETQPDAPYASALATATRIIDEFGGLAVGACGRGAEMAASDVQFYERFDPEANALFQSWRRQIGEVVAFASAARDYMILSAGANGSFYVFSYPDHRLCAGPHHFAELMRCLLLGYRLGPTIPEDPDLPAS